MVPHFIILYILHHCYFLLRPLFLLKYQLHHIFFVLLQVSYFEIYMDKIRDLLDGMLTH